MLKQKRPRNCLIFTVGIVTLVSSLSIFLLFLAYKNYTERSQRNRTYQEIGEEIRSRVGIGDEREKALQAMVAAGAWSSIKCEEIDNDVIYDYFYFGPKDKDKAFVFMTASVYQDGQYKLDYIYNNSDSITYIPEACLPPELK